MAVTGGNLGIIRAWGSGFDGWDADMDKNLLLLDALAQPIVKDTTIATPPGSPAQGDAYVVAASPTGAWSSHAAEVAIWDGAAWVLSGAPKTGWSVYNQADGYVYVRLSGGWTSAYKVGASGLLTLPSGLNLGQQDLANYSEGTWTPAIVGATTPGSNTYGVQQGTYTRVGRLVIAHARIVLTAKDVTLAGFIRVSGLPFTAAAASAQFSGVVGFASNFTTPAGTTQFGTDVLATSTVAQLYAWGSGVAISTLTDTALASNSVLACTLTYHV